MGKAQKGNLKENQKAEGESERETKADLARDLNNLESFISSSYANLRKGGVPLAQADDTPGGYLRRLGEVSIDKVKDSPNLSDLFQAWREADKGEVVSALQKWLVWTRDLRMDLQNDDKPN